MTNEHNNTLNPTPHFALDGDQPLKMVARHDAAQASFQLPKSTGYRPGKR